MFRKYLNSFKFLKLVLYPYQKFSTFPVHYNFMFIESKWQYFQQCVA
jgi:hypothetical protein